MHRLEAIAGIARDTTMKLAFAPERDIPLLLGQISRGAVGRLQHERTHHTDNP
ncbi:hypothetical protein [Nocardia salmonicida]|uniref:hypothetical protein n=1 Tax=Nocardia salmonicida TaxID=53431 RepID=UPI0033FBDC95